MFSVPLRTVVGLDRSVGQADSWWEAGRMRDVECSNSLEMELVCIQF